ncbi:FctA domain-containing protein, partial [Enterococcus avium]
KVIFDEISYDQAGIYEYTISEAIPTEKETGVTYDDTKYKVTVTVEEKAGKLEATVVYENIKAGEVPTFKNTYKALPGTIQLEAKKELSGRPLKADEFSFTLKGDGGVDQTKKMIKPAKYYSMPSRMTKPERMSTQSPKLSQPHQKPE